MRLLISFTLALSLTPIAHGNVRAALPLQGYHRPGLFMPVKVEATASTNVIEITGSGVVTTRVAHNGVVPVLVARAADSLLVNGTTVQTSLRALPEGTRLVGSTIANPAAAEKGTLVVMLDPQDPLPGPAIAWEALDELVIDASSRERIGDPKLRGLLAAGVTVMLMDAEKPTGLLPWRRERAAWVVRPTLFGPRGSVFAPVMLPVGGAGPGHPETVRRGALLAATLFAILATGLALLRPRFVTLAMAALVVVALGGIHAWLSRQPAVSTVGGAVAVDGRELRQVDDWTYAFATDRDAVVALGAGARPMAESAEALARLRLDWVVGDEFACRLARGGRVASMRRQLTFPSASFPDSVVTSPLLPLVKAGYVGPGVTIRGQIPASPWPTVVVTASDR